MSSTRTRSNPLSTANNEKLGRTYFVCWYNKSKTFSQAFRLNDSRFSYPMQERLKWKTGTTIFVQKKVMGTIICLGDLTRVAEFSAQLDDAIVQAPDYDTEDALQFAEAYDKQEAADIEVGDDIDDPDFVEEPSTSSTDNEPDQQDEQAKMMEKEAQKIRVLALASGLPSTTPKKPSARNGASSDANSATSEFHTGASVRSNAASVSTASSVTSSAASATGTVPAAAETAGFNCAVSNNVPSPASAGSSGVSKGSENGVSPTKIDWEALSKDLLAGIKGMNKIGKEVVSILKDIRANTTPEAALDPGFAIMNNQGQQFTIEEIPADVPTQFALQCIDRMQGPNYIRTHRFEQEQKQGNEWEPASDEVIKLLKDALRARFGRTHWRPVRLALNQASRDRASKYRSRMMKANSGNGDK